MFSSTRAVEVQQPDGSTTLLAHLAHLVMPQRFPALVQQQQCTAAGSTSVQQQADEAGAAPAASSQQRQVAEQVAAAGPDPLGALMQSTEPAAGTAAGSSSAPSPPPAAAGDTAVLPQQWPASCSAVYVCGVQPDWCTPLGWLHEHMKAADGFLYVAVHLTA